MLIEFSVENFRSISDKVVFSMISSNYYKNLDNNLISIDSSKKNNLLRSSIILGPNATGKTNVIMAINVFSLLIKTSHLNQQGNKLPHNPFKLDEKYLDKPTKFSIVYLYNDIRYDYSFSYDRNRIIDESLYYYPKGKKSLLFERKNTNDYKFTLDKSEQKFISKRTLDNVLYLSNATKEKYLKITEAFKWFTEKLRIIGPADHPSLEDFTMNMAEKDKRYKELILKSLTIADFGIHNISSSKKEVKLEELPTEIREFINARKKITGADQEKIESRLINTYHWGKNKTNSKIEVKFDIEEESEGTKRMFSLIGPWIDALDNGRIIIADELDTKLHHYLQTFLIDLFNNPNQNKKNSQIIFTSHNINLLDQDIFRRDQIWFTKKNDEIENTELYSLSEFKERKDKDIINAYLSGRYAAIPFIKSHKVF
jgi:AAA15 family ATPase/GTPase